ncbi:MAG: hypothetical protein E6J90_10850 [Deltaproteobacteria bacterium]|nr:MAG: hypothetical protein E6J91_09860 [Deltaproteobacteria bacterium]TMQ23242.1 MAG: hypothetical protein E6J90_10850 [Deltaproteobacteria bacterium]
MSLLRGVARAGAPRDHVPGMRVLAAIGLAILFAIGAGLGLAIGAVVFFVSWRRSARAVHADGVVCRGELTAADRSAARLAGPALVRLSGALEGQATTGTDVLGVEIRMQRTARNDAAHGDQDLVFGSFESFATAARDRARTNAGDYLANCYSTVTPWWLTSHGPVILRLIAAPAAAPERGSDRLARLDADLVTDRARFSLVVDAPAGRVALGELRLVERLAIDDRALRVSMFRQGRGVRPLGLRNGIRATVYPMSQLARRLRGG